MAVLIIFPLMLHADSHQCQNAAYWKMRGKYVRLASWSLG